jgi:Tol biopolymer transport system component
MVRNRRVSAFAMVLVLVAAAVAAYALARGDTGEVPANGATISVQNAAGSMVDVRTGEVTPLPASIARSGDYYAVSPDHTTVAFSACCTASSPVFVANVDGTQVHQISAIDAYAAQWSPDGSMLVYQQRNSSTDHLGNLFVASVATGQQTQVTNFDQTQRWGYWAMLPTFTADGRSILFQLPRGDRPNHPIDDLWTVPVTGGTQTLVRRDASVGAYSPDGSSLAYLSQIGGQGALSIASVRGGTPRMLVEGNLDWLRWSPDGTRISYLDGASIYVLDVATGSSTNVAEGGNAEWFDDNTLIVAHPPN